MTAAERKDLEGQIAQGGPLKKDLEYALASLRRLDGPAGGDLPFTVTEAVGEFGREVAGMLEERLATENDEGLRNTVSAFIAKLGRGESVDFNAAIGKLATDHKLDDLALELAVQDREFIHTHPNVRYFGPYEQLRAAVDQHGNAHVKELWQKVASKIDKMPFDAIKDGRLAGAEASREVKLALSNGDRALLERAAAGLAHGTQVVMSILPMPPLMNDFDKAKLNAGIRSLGRSGKLDDMVRELGKTESGKAILDSLARRISQNGTAAVRSAWADAGGAPDVRYTTMAAGEEGRGPNIP